MTAPATAICVMAKAPVPGAVKTRMCPPLGHEQAARLAAAFLLDVWTAARAVPGAVALLAHAGDRGKFPAQLAGADGFAQRGGDLGARIEHAAREGLARAGEVLVIGSDLPGLTAGMLADAARALADAPAVLGPSADGGFWLIGLRAAPTDLLADLPWSAPETRAACAARLSERGMSPALVAGFDDVDDAADLARLCGALGVDAPSRADAATGPGSVPPPRGAITAPHTAAALAALAALRR